MGETAAAGGVFMGLGLRGVRGSGAAAAVGVVQGLPLEGGPERKVKRKKIKTGVRSTRVTELP